MGPGLDPSGTQVGPKWNPNIMLHTMIYLFQQLQALDMIDHCQHDTFEKYLQALVLEMNTLPSILAYFAYTLFHYTSTIQFLLLAVY